MDTCSLPGIRILGIRDNKANSLESIGINFEENFFKTTAGIWSGPGDLFMSSPFRMDFTVLFSIMIWDISRNPVTSEESGLTVSGKVE